MLFRIVESNTDDLFQQYNPCYLRPLVRTIINIPIIIITLYVNIFISNLILIKSNYDLLDFRYSI